MDLTRRIGGKGTRENALNAPMASDGREARLNGEIAGNILETNEGFSGAWWMGSILLLQKLARSSSQFFRNAGGAISSSANRQAPSGYVPTA